MASELSSQARWSARRCASSFLRDVLLFDLFIELPCTITVPLRVGLDLLNACSRRCHFGFAQVNRACKSAIRDSMTVSSCWA